MWGGGGAGLGSQWLSPSGSPALLSRQDHLCLGSLLSPGQVLSPALGGAETAGLEKEKEPGIRPWGRGWALGIQPSDLSLVLVVFKSPLSGQTRKSGPPAPPPSNPGVRPPAPSSLRSRSQGTQPFLSQTQECGPPAPSFLKTRSRAPQTQYPGPSAFVPQGLEAQAPSAVLTQTWDSWPPTPLLRSRNSSAQPPLPGDPSALWPPP